MTSIFKERLFGFAVTAIEPALLEKVPEFKHRLEWFHEHRPALPKLIQQQWECRDSESQRLRAWR